MIATPFAVVSHEPVESPKKRQRKAWAPDGKDEMVYKWVKFEGKSQTWVADSLGLSQSTVSRIVQRYEKWQAHAEPGEDGSLTPAERQRAQRRLTFERNEVILASCLRIAGDVEHAIDASRSVTYHNRTKPSQPTDVRTEWTRPERCGLAARFLRLAFRINMEQQKLVDMEPLEQLPPLSEEDLAEQIAVTDDARAEKEAARHAADERAAFEERVRVEVQERVASELHRIQLEAEEYARQISEGESGGEGEGEMEMARAEAGDLAIRDSVDSPIVELNVHNLHSCIAGASCASDAAADGCEQILPAEKSAGQECIAARTSERAERQDACPAMDGPPGEPARGASAHGARP